MIRRTLFIFIILSLIFITSQAKPIPKNDEARSQLMNFQRVISLVKSRYVKEVSSKDMVYSAIDAMLEKLDPHSNFLDAKAYKKMTEDHAGSFGGLGIVITIRDDVLTIVAPIEGTPAHKMGLTAGDRIIKIEGEPTEGITTEEAVSKMRGEIGTSVTITIERDEWQEPQDFTIIRGVIPVESVPYAFEIRPGVGYVRITRFTRTVSKELKEALAKLDEKNIESLILDLRGNPGGYLEQAVAVVEQFIDAGKMVVFTKGRIPRSSREHHARSLAKKRDYPLIVLVNNGSASASEIVSGALQDWDRALIVGETTFGKGLVQNLFPLSADVGSALKLTVAKYYTPSGRCIQRPYKDIDVWTYRNPKINKRKDGELNQTDESEEVFRTFGGREVKAGGGITPDIEIKPGKLSKLMSQIERKAYFSKFALKVFKNDAPESVEEIHNSIEKYVDKFKEYLSEIGFEYKADDFDENMENIIRGLKRELVREYWSENSNYHVAREEAYKIAVEGDSQVLEALKYIQQAKDLISSED